MREYVTLPNVLTSASLGAGFLAVLVAPTNVGAAAALVGSAAVLDFLDGAAARRGAGGSDFGMNLDSLADLVSFGAAPALALYHASFRAWPVVGFFVCFAFVLAGTWRLARFPLVKQATTFVGLPIPLAGVLLVLLAAWTPPILLALLVTLGLSALMVSRLPFPTLPMFANGTRSRVRHTAHRTRLRVRHTTHRRLTRRTTRSGLSVPTPQRRARRRPRRVLRVR